MSGRKPAVARSVHGHWLPILDPDRQGQSVPPISWSAPFFLYRLRMFTVQSPYSWFRASFVGFEP